MHSASETESEAGDMSESEETIGNDLAINEHNEHQPKFPADLVVESGAADPGATQDTVALMGDTDFTPEVEAIEKDFQVMQEELQQQSATNPKENSQVANFNLK